MKSKRAYLVKERTFEIRTDDIFPRDNQILVRVKLCGLCNWELHFYKGIGGDFYTNYPKVVGHEWAGVVVEKGKNVQNFEIGDKVTFLPGDFQGFAEYTAVDAADCYKLNPDVDLDNAMGEPLKCIRRKQFHKIYRRFSPSAQRVDFIDTLRLFKNKVFNSLTFWGYFFVALNSNIC